MNNLPPSFRKFTTKKNPQSPGEAKAAQTIPDLSVLAELDLTSKVHYKDHPVTKGGGGESSVAQQLPEGINISIRLPNGAIVKGKRMVLTDLDNITVYKGNPRADSRPEISSLAQNLRRTKGNITPVLVRQTETPAGSGVYKLELIAGKRRLEASKEAQTHLLADVITEIIADSICDDIAFVENSDRDDPDVWAMAAFFFARFHDAKQKESDCSIDSFARGYGISRQHMSDYLNLAKIPVWLVNLCNRYKKTGEAGRIDHAWTFRTANRLKSLLTNIVDDPNYENLKSSIGDDRFTTPADLFSYIKDFANHTTTTQTPPQELLYNDQVIATVTVGKRKKGLKLALNSDAPQELFDRIHLLLSEYGLKND